VPDYRLSATAVRDIDQLLAYTRERFGEAARHLLGDYGNE